MPEILKLGGSSFHPSAANTGNEQATVLRGKNMMLRGSEGSFYFEAYGGHKNLHERIPMMQLTGTISYEEGSPTVLGSGTAFKRELRFGQKFVAGNPLQVFVVDDIVSNTEVIVQRVPDADGTNEESFKPAHLFEINNQRGTLVWGNAQKSDRGNIIAVGEGRLRLNGQPLPGDDFVASRRLQLAIFDPNTNLYSVDEMGFDFAPPSDGVSISVVAGGEKDMTQGFYSFRWSWADSTTGYGFSNPSEVMKLDTSNDLIEVTASKQRFKLDFTSGLGSRPVNADAIIVYRSMFSDPAQNTTQAAEGSWFVASTVRIDDLEPGDILHIDVLDGELGTEITFDNDVPPDADWVSFLAGDPILISCYGDKVVGGSDRGASPGPFVSLGRRGNRHGFPAANATVLSPPDTIIGFLPGVGRLFLLTRTGLPFAAATGQDKFPVETRAFWQTGFKSPFGLVLVNDTLYAFTHKGPTKSIATGDAGSEQFAFAGAVEEITRHWNAGYVHAVHDQQNEMVVLIHSADHRDEDGFWVSVALPYYLRYGMFGPLIEISKPGRDMIVTGAASVGGKLQFLAGGRGEVDEFSSEDESSEEEPPESTNPVNPESDAIICSGNCGVFGAGHGHLNSPTNVTFDDDILHGNGTNTLLFQSDGTNKAGVSLGPLIQGETGSTYMAWIWAAVRFSVYFETLPTKDILLWWHSDAGGISPSQNGIGYDTETGTIRLGMYNGFFGPNYNWDATGIPVTTGVWYDIDFNIDGNHGDSTITMDGRVNGVDLPSHIHGSFLAYVGGPSMNGLGGNLTQKYRIADIYATPYGPSYPVGEGYVRRFVPKSDGTHNIGADGTFTRGSSVTPINNATTTAWQLIDDVPMDDGVPVVDDYITQAQDTGGGLNYVECVFDSPDGFIPPRPPYSLDVSVGYHATNTSGNFKAKLNDDGEVKSILEFSGVGSENIRFRTRHFPNPVLALTGWSTVPGPGDFNNLRIRFGYSSDADPDQSLDGAMMEAFFLGDASE